VKAISYGSLVDIRVPSRIPRCNGLQLSEPCDRVFVSALVLRNSSPSAAGETELPRIYPRRSRPPH